ncbi:MAG: ADP-ribosylglycohydrolase family protein [Anaerobiospirillum succiniciproducens]|uniref:ADP-ribosylglycohydrolase family protein n=1 Tax=Anaerobiospirillum succiniciproducens TaxID=13335 RepID=UPI002A74D4CE|nr:ADP-ribosylglycohydrolase family protein [Anaerobiospirillum succiniciproducens]MDY2798169.1 ADP-ribosylglycohydrolase family protein [Anaerobiospirillum succiniciproducens]
MNTSIATSTIHYRALGAMLGAAYGDALGWPNERSRNKAQAPEVGSFHKLRAWQRDQSTKFAILRYEIEKGSYSDDTQMILCLSRALLKSDQWYKHYTTKELPFWQVYQRGGGGATKSAVKAWASGIAPWLSDEKERFFNAGGNGVAMRVLPHAIMGYQLDFGHTAHNILLDGIATHGHPQALVGALAYGYALWYALRQGSLANNHTLLSAPNGNAATQGSNTGVAIESNGVGPYPSAELFYEANFAKEVLDAIDEWSACALDYDLPESFIELAQDSSSTGANYSYRATWDGAVATMQKYLVTAASSCEHITAALANVKSATGANVASPAFYEQVDKLNDNCLKALNCFDKNVSGAGTVAAAVAIYQASAYLHDPVRGIVRLAFAKGSDTDTNASMAAALLGSVYGEGFIDSETLAEVQDKDCIREYAQALVNSAYAQPCLDGATIKTMALGGQKFSERTWSNNFFKPIKDSTKAKSAAAKSKAKSKAAQDTAFDEGLFANSLLSDADMQANPLEAIHSADEIASTMRQAYAGHISTPWYGFVTDKVLPIGLGCKTFYKLERSDDTGDKLYIFARIEASDGQTFYVKTSQTIKQDKDDDASAAALAPSHIADTTKGSLAQKATRDAMQASNASYTEPADTLSDHAPQNPIANATTNVDASACAPVVSHGTQSSDDIIGFDSLINGTHAQAFSRNSSTRPATPTQVTLTSTANNLDVDILAATSHADNAINNEAIYRNISSSDLVAVSAVSSARDNESSMVQCYQAGFKVCAESFERSIAFYKDCLGLTIKKQTRNTVSFEQGITLIASNYLQSKCGLPNAFRLRSLIFLDVSNIRWAYEQLQRSSFTIISDIAPWPKSDKEFFRAQDPDGNIVEVFGTVTHA